MVNGQFVIIKLNAEMEIKISYNATTAQALLFLGLNHAITLDTEAMKRI
jgi:hypothetical protein